MRRRFSRRRRSSNSDGRQGGDRLDAAAWLERITEQAGIGATGLEPVTNADVPDHYAVIGRGQSADGTALVLGFAPKNGGDALLAALATALDAPEGEPFAGEVIALAPQWSATSQRRLGAIGDPSFRLRAVASSVLGGTSGESAADVAAEVALSSVGLDANAIANVLEDATDRQLFRRAARGLEGLASKHGGALRSANRSLELVVMTRRVAALHAGARGVELETYLPQRSMAEVTAGELAGALDRLEGHLRKRLNDRRARDGEEGLRTAGLDVIAQAASLRNLVFWPLTGSDPDVIDAVGVGSDGVPVVVVVRKELSLPTLGEVLDATASLVPVLPMLLAGADAPLRFGALRLVLAAEQIAPAAARVMSLLAHAHELFEIRRSSRGLEMAPISSGEAASRPVPSRSERPGGPAARGRRPGRRSDGEARAEGEAAPSDGSSDETASEGATTRSGSRSRRGRRGRGRTSGEGSSTSAEASAQATDSNESAEPAPRRSAGYESVSFFDLDDGSEEPGDTRESEDGDSGARRRRRGGRGRRRGRRAAGDESGRAGGASGDDDADAAAPPERAGSKREPGDIDSSADPDADDDVVDLDETLAPMVQDLSEFDIAMPVVAYEDDDDDDAADSGAGQRSGQAVAASSGASSSLEARPEAEEQRFPRRRAAIVVHADSDSIMSGILLARDIRLVEGFWVYPQADLMTFFRSVTPELRDNTPIYVIGFTLSPAFEVLPTASLCGDRLHWFDYHEWPPEDLDALRNAIGEERLHYTPGTGSVLPAVLATGKRRSRFSDKLVDLAIGRFSQHDYERWGRLWWSRICEMADQPGDRRNDVEKLLVGRPSELAREAAKVPPPPVPPEVEMVASRDYRVVYFAGYGLVIVEVPAEFDLYLTARIARERYGVALSLAYRVGGDLVIFSGDDPGNRRTLDFSAVIEHLAQKLEGVEALPNDDHVARLRIEGLAQDVTRLDPVIAEIAMGRSVLEG